MSRAHNEHNTQINRPASHWAVQAAVSLVMRPVRVVLGLQQGGSAKPNLSVGVSVDMELVGKAPTVM